jgi:hypothetical protein
MWCLQIHWAVTCVSSFGFSRWVLQLGMERRERALRCLGSYMGKGFHHIWAQEVIHLSPWAGSCLGVEKFFCFFFFIIIILFFKENRLNSFSYLFIYFIIFFLSISVCRQKNLSLDLWESHKSNNKFVKDSLCSSIDDFFLAYSTLFWNVIYLWLHKLFNCPPLLKIEELLLLFLLFIPQFYLLVVGQLVKSIEVQTFVLTMW